MKQVVFAIALLAMASLTGCLNTDDTSIDENIDTTDDSTSDTTEDNTDTTQDDTDTTDDTKDDELIEPVGTDGDTIPEDSSVFMDSENVGVLGNYECTNPYDGDGDGDENGYSDDAEDVTCTYTYYGTDYFENNYNNDGEFNGISYKDADGIGNSINFNGWVNKTGKEITIESLYYPDRGIYESGHTNCWDIDDDGGCEQVPNLYHYTNRPVSNYCATAFCDITFYGVNGLEYNAHFMTTSSMGTRNFAIDYDNDGNKDSMLYRYIYQKHTLNFDLPFEPYGFSLVYDGNRVDRIF